MAGRSPTKFLLTKMLPFCLLLGVAGEVAHAQAPVVTGVSFFRSPETGDTFELSEVVVVQVDFDRSVTVAGRPRLALRIGAQTRQAEAGPYGGVQAFSNIRFSYVVRPSDHDPNGISIDANALTLNGATIREAGGSMVNAQLGLGSHAVVDSGNHKVDGRLQTAPSVSTVFFDTSPASGDTYELGESIVVRVAFDRAIVLTGNRPRLALTIGTQRREARYAGVFFGNSIAFRYYPVPSDRDANGVSVDEDALTLVGGAVRIRGGSADASLSLGARAFRDAAAHKVDGSLETAPEVSRVIISSRPRLSSDTYGRAEWIGVIVGFDRPVAVTGAPQLALEVGARTRQASIGFTSFYGTFVLFQYAVQSGDLDANGISVRANALTLNGGTIKIRGGTTDAVLRRLDFHTVSDATDHRVDGSGEVPPTVDSVEVSSPASGNTFKLGEAIKVTVWFTHAMQVVGSPELALNIGAHTRHAEWLDYNRTAVGREVFSYTVQSGDSDEDGISIDTNALKLNDGAIKILGGTTDAVLTLPSFWTTFYSSAGYKVDGSASGPMDVRVESAGSALLVSWRAVSGASAYRVQWRVVGAAWSSLREAETTETQYEVGSLGAGDYEVRVFAVVDGEDGEPSAPVRGEVAEVGNQRPRVVEELPDLEIDVGETVAVNAAAVFQDADRDSLRYSASSDADLLSVRVVEGVVRVRGVRPGEANVSVTAEDPAGLGATTTFRVTVGTLLTVEGERTTVPEGGTVVVALDLSRPLAASLAVRWHLAADEDASTADVDMADYGEPAGEVSIPAGQTSATIEVAIIDDADIEPAREHFVVQIEQPEDENVGLARNARVEAVIQEGVCDRTPAIRDELSQGWRGCHWPKPTTLAAVRSLDLSGQKIDALRSNDLLGLHGLRRLDLSNNMLATLPPGLFARVEGLREVSVEGNPGAPFTLTVELARLDAEPWAPGPAQLVAQTMWAAPFSLAATLSVSPTGVAGDLPATVDIAAGTMAGQPFSVASNNGVALALRTDAAPLPTTRCGDNPCFRGFQTMPGPALTLFRQPPRALPSPTLEPLQGGDELRLPLASLVEAEDPMDELRWQATSSDDALATVRIVEGSLVVTPELATAGTVEVTLVVTDTVGFSITLRLEVSVEFHWPRSPTRGWRSTLMGIPRTVGRRQLATDY